MCCMALEMNEDDELQLTGRVELEDIKHIMSFTFRLNFQTEQFFLILTDVLI